MFSALITFIPDCIFVSVYQCTRIILGKHCVKPILFGGKYRHTHKQIFALYYMTNNPQIGKTFHATLGTMIRNMLRNYGVKRVVLLFTILAIIASFLITGGIIFLDSGNLNIDPVGLWIAVIAPAIIAPVLSYRTFRILLQLDIAEEKLILLAMTDDLTGVYNRRHFMELADNLFSQAKRYDTIFSVAIMDIDDFKHINDTYGHLAGDRVLRIVSEICMRELRESDLFARYGGDEFIFLLYKTGEEQAEKVMGRIQKVIAETQTIFETENIQIHISYGIASFKPDIEKIETLLIRADLELYSDKRDRKMEQPYPSKKRGSH